MKRTESKAGGVLLAVLATATAIAQPPTRLGEDDRSAIQDLVTSYARALAECRAEEFADLFVPETGYFASGFRGHIVGREKLVALVESERHCRPSAGSTPSARPGGATGPTVVLEIGADGVRGVADLGTAEYQDEYAKTPRGWRFAARTVIVAAEKAAGLDADALLAIQRLGGLDLGDHYATDDSGVERFLSSGVAVSVSGDAVTGRAYLENGGYRDEVYEQLASGEWRVKSSTYVPPQSIVPIVVR
jgi:hypothetical protein